MRVQVGPGRRVEVPECDSPRFAAGAEGECLCCMGTGEHSTGSGVDPNAWEYICESCDGTGGIEEENAYVA